MGDLIDDRRWIQFADGADVHVGSGFKTYWVDHVARITSLNSTANVNVRSGTIETYSRRAIIGGTSIYSSFALLFHFGSMTSTQGVNKCIRFPNTVLSVQGDTLNIPDPAQAVDANVTIDAITQDFVPSTVTWSTRPSIGGVVAERKIFSNTSGLRSGADWTSKNTQAFNLDISSIGSTTVLKSIYGLRLLVHLPAHNVGQVQASNLVAKYIFDVSYTGLDMLAGKGGFLYVVQ